MNAAIPALRLRIAHPTAFTSIVNLWGFEMDCEYEYDAGEPSILSPADASHPGCPPNAELIGCRIRGVQVIEMLTLEQRERIEEKLIEQMEGL